MAPPTDAQCANHTVRLDALERSKEHQSGLMIDVRDRVIRVETQLATLSSTWRSYGWPLLMMIASAFVGHFAWR